MSERSVLPINRLIPDFSPLGEIIQKCSHSHPPQRYQKVLQIMKAVENRGDRHDWRPGLILGCYQASTHGKTFLLDENDWLTEWAHD
jgi:hypothetical protein